MQIVQTSGNNREYEREQHRKVDDTQAIHV